MANVKPAWCQKTPPLSGRQAGGFDSPAVFWHDDALIFAPGNSFLPVNAENDRIGRPVPGRQHDHIAVIIFLLFIWGAALLCIGIGLACFDKPDPACRRAERPWQGEKPFPLSVLRLP